MGTRTDNICFEQKYEKKYQFLFENFQFSEVKFSIYLNRHVFIMGFNDPKENNNKVCSEIQLELSVSKSEGYFELPQNLVLNHAYICRVSHFSYLAIKHNPTIGKIES